MRDLWTPIKLINQGVVIRTNGANLTFQMNGGTLWGNGINWIIDELNPDSVAIAGQIPTTFQYRNQTGTQSAFTDRTTIDPNNYDIGGVATSISGAKYTNQRVYLYPTGIVRVQYGQEFYTTLPKAITGIQLEAFIEYVNNRDNGILIGIISVKAGTTDLTDINNCQFTAVSKFGELLGGAAGGVSTTNLQGAYDNSNSNPEILTNSTLGPVNIRRGSVADTDDVITVQNGAGTDTTTITGDGHLTTQSLTIAALTATSSSLDYVVVDGSGNTYYKTVFAGTSGTSGYSGTSGTSGAAGSAGSSGTSGTGFNTILTPADYRILTATGSSTNSAVAQSNLSFNPNTGILGVSGSVVISGTAGGNLLSVNGTSGQLFSITDTLTGSLFSVNDISGLPILEVFSDNTTLIGDYQAPSLYTTKTVTANTGTTSIYSISTTSYTGAFIDYNIINGTNARSGNVTAIWLGSNIQYSETSTIDIGTTSNVNFGFVISGTYAVLQVSTTTNSWTVKTIIRSI